MREKKSIPFLLFYTLCSLLFLIDLGALSIVERPLLYFLLCFYILQLSRPMGIARILFACGLLSLIPLIHYGRFGVGLIYLIPATLVGVKMRHILYDSIWHYYLLLAACILAQIGLVEYWILNLPISVSYTISTIAANILVIGIMSLIVPDRPRSFSL